MCKVSEETILKANERMRKYKIGQNNKNVSPMGGYLGHSCPR